MPQSLTHIVTVVLAKRDADLFSKALSLISQPGSPTILSDNLAFEFQLEIDHPKQAQADFLQMFDQQGIAADICVQPNIGRKKKLLICDMDSTLIGQECIDELADYAGMKDQVSAITERAMRGEIDFESALKERVRLLKDLPISVLETCFEARISLNSGASTLARTMRANGATTVIVSGGFTFFTQRIAALAGFEHHHANQLGTTDDHLTGEVIPPILGRAAKREQLEHYSRSRGGPAQALAIGDGANDLAMIEIAGLGLAYHAKPAVAQAAQAAIEHTPLTTALYFQGYREEEFVS